MSTQYNEYVSRFEEMFSGVILIFFQKNNNNMKTIIKEEIFPILESYGFDLIKYNRSDNDYNPKGPYYDIDLCKWVDNGVQYNTTEDWRDESNQDILKNDNEYFEPYFSRYIGESRRGQFYYLEIYKDRKLTILATEPDGSGGNCTVPLEVLEILAKLYSNNAFEKE